MGRGPQQAAGLVQSGKGGGGWGGGEHGGVVLVVEHLRSRFGFPLAAQKYVLEKATLIPQGTG